MSDEPKTEKYGFTQTKFLHLLGPGEEFSRKDMVAIQVYGDHPEVSRMVHESMAAAPAKHWHATVTVPEKADVNTRLYSTVWMTEPLWKLNQKLFEKYGLPDAVSGRPERAPA